MKKNLRMTGFAKLIKTVAPNTYKHFNCTVEGQLIHTAYLHYDRALHWEHTTTDKLIEYLKFLELNEFISQERIDYFMHYIVAIYFLNYEYAEKDTDITPTFKPKKYKYFIHQHLKNFKTIDNIPSRFVEHPVTLGDMSIFFCLFLKASNCLKEIDYELTEIQRSKIESLKSQTDLSLRESFERLVRIFFS